MATEIALDNYYKQVSQLLEERRYAEAVLHAQHILRHYPRHILTYRLLGQALLEQHDYAGAADLFQRVLSADPNDFIAHLGLSIAYGEEALYSQAIWHLRHAHEMDPYNVNIQRELRELYRQQDGEYVAEIAISPVALARLHFKAGQYQRASSELRAMLQTDTDERVDLELLLAESLWRDRQRLEAVPVCEAVLTKLPNCITANAILGGIYLRAERQVEAAPHLQLVQALTQVDEARLDPETAVGAAFLLPGAPPLPQQVLIVPLGEQAVAESLGLVQEAVPPTIAEWVSELEGNRLTVDERDSYDWLAAAQGEDDDVETAVSAVVDSNAVVQDDAIPEWLKGTETSQRPAAMDGSQGELGDVMEAIVADDNENKKRSQEVPDDTPPEMDDALAWLDELIGEENAPQTEAAPTEAAQPLPDWLQAAPDEVDVAAAAIPNDDLPDWLKEAALTSETKLPGVLDEQTAEASVAAGMADDDVAEAEISPIDTDLSWLDALTAGASESSDEMPTMTWSDEAAADEPQDFEEAMAWLEELAAEQETPIEEPPTVARGLFGTEVLDSGTVDDLEVAESDEAMAWLDEMIDEPERPSLANTAREATNAALGHEADDEAMAWLGEMGIDEGETAVSADLAAALDWLEAQTETEVGDEKAAVEELPTAAFAQLDDDLDWLAQLSLADEVVEAPAVADEMPEDPDEALAWLEQMAGDTVQMDEPQAAVAAEEVAEGDTTFDVPEDPDEAMAWLEQLAARQGAPLDELPSLQAEEPVAAVDDDTTISWPDDLGVAEVEETAVVAADVAVPEDPDEAMAWLEELAAKQEASSDELPRLQAEEPELEPEVVIDDAEAMGWLDELAAEAGVAAEVAVAETAVVVEPDTMPTAEGEADSSEPPDDLDEAMAWLEGLAAKQGASLDELPSLQAEVSEPELESEPEPEVAIGDDEAMGWLDELAAEAEVAETAVVAEPDTMPAAEVEADSSEPPDDLDAAMAWLEGLAAKQGAPLDELPSLQVEGLEPELGSEPEPEVAIGDDEAMGWLAELAAEAEVAETAVVAEPDTMPTAEADSSEPPDDLDAAMAWLEELAAKQGASLDELPSLQAEAPEPEPEATIDDDAAMSWLDELAAEAGVAEEMVAAEEEDVVAGEPALTAGAEAEDALDWLEALAETPKAEVVEQAEAEGVPAWLSEEVVDEPDEVADETLLAEPEDVIPEWLADEPAPSVGDTGWLRSLAEPDVSGWLASEAEPTTGRLEQEGFGTDALQMDAEPELELERPFVPPPVAETAPMVSVDTTTASLMAVDEDRLAVARAAVGDGGVETAVSAYQSLLAGGTGLSILIADLEKATSQLPRQAPLQQLLGDAYLRNGQLQKAVDTYRQALNSL